MIGLNFNKLDLNDFISNEPNLIKIILIELILIESHFIEFNFIELDFIDSNFIGFI